MTVEVLGLDGDDTLWRNEEYFADTQRAFRALLASYVGDDIDLDDRMNATERANLELFGYGVKGFTLSLIETAIAASGGRNAAADVIPPALADATCEAAAASGGCTVYHVDQVGHDVLSSNRFQDVVGEIDDFLKGITPVPSSG